MSEPVYPLATVYCTDEDLAIRCPTDLRILTPADSLAAAGSDGAFAAGLPWTLGSATVDFEAQGVAPGSLIHLEGGAIRGSGGYFVVDSVAGPVVGLRRIGMASGLGQPPAPAAGMTGVRFAVTTLAPQIEQASDELNRRFGIDPTSSLRGPTAVYDLRELQEAAMLTVLLRQYTLSTRTGDGDFAFKVRELKASLDAAAARLQVRWGPTGSDAPTSGVFGMRIVRG
ncbi:hypothetical protein [Paludisphaera soli]|uniref:hypothetical protein n=1 Tax=Paludisphaera soli TaxID=2712865 RepID=UPI0013EDA1DA|nr:hypothetical protein [Paludisphaera soli]